MVVNDTFKTKKPSIASVYGFYLGLRKEWICNERPITICPIVTC